MGPIVCILYEKESPITVKNFVGAGARWNKAWTDPKTKTKTTRPLYSGTIFHRVIPGFMIQGGDPTGTGMGNGGLTPIPEEFSPSLKFDKPGRLGMAKLEARGPALASSSLPMAPRHTWMACTRFSGRSSRGRIWLPRSQMFLGTEMISRRRRLRL